MPVERHLQVDSLAIKEHTLQGHNKGVVVQLNHALCLSDRLPIPLNAF